MLSIIVSTYKPDNFRSFEQNVADTIGIEYEIIKIENNGVMGLCTAYNKGITLAKFPYICFAHDDISFTKPNWGKNFIHYFEEHPVLGLIGIAGSSNKTWVPSGWSYPDPEYRSFCKMDILQQEASGIRRHIRNKPEDKDYAQVVTLDGCFMFSTKKVLKEIQFDEINFKGFHCYDIDFSLQVSLQSKVFVLFDTGIIHYSEGGFKKDWLQDSMKFHKKWKSLLPISCEKFSKDDIRYSEYNAYQFLLAKVSLFKTCRFYLFTHILNTSKMYKSVGFNNWIKLQLWSIKSVLKF